MKKATLFTIALLAAFTAGLYIGVEHRYPSKKDWPLRKVVSAIDTGAGLMFIDTLPDIFISADEKTIFYQKKEYDLRSAGTATFSSSITASNINK